MRKTPFAGLTILEPGEGLDTDNGAFIDRDRETIDHLLRLGAKLHRHNALVGLENPQQAASGLLIASGGTIASNLTISLGYTIEDASGGETKLSPLAVVSTGSPLDIPSAAPSAAVDYTAGSLLVDTYYYALTWIDGEGGETPSGPAVSIERAPGFASGRVKLSNLVYGMAAAGAVGWRLFRAKGGGSYDLLTTGGLADNAFTDDGTVSVDCDIHPPTDSQNTTNQINTLKVVLPKADANMVRATNINLYASLTGDFSEGSSLAQFPIASAGQSAIFRSLELSDLMPPDVNLSIGGASLIDPDTELLDWSWRRTVASSAALGSGLVGWVKLARDSGQLYGVLAPLASASGASQWVPLGSGAGGPTVESDLGPTAVKNTGTISLVGSGGIKITANEEGKGKARVTISSPLLRASAASGNPGFVAPYTDLVFVASGGASASVKELSPGVAQVTLTVPKAAAGGSVAFFGSGSAAPGAETSPATKIELIGSGGVNITETSPGGGVAKAIVEGQAATLMSQGMGVMVLTTAQKGAARPKGFKQITWFCKEKPTNMAEFDIWIEEGP